MGNQISNFNVLYLPIAPSSTTKITLKSGADPALPNRAGNNVSTTHGWFLLLKKKIDELKSQNQELKTDCDKNTKSNEDLKAEIEKIKMYLNSSANKQ